MALSRGGQVAFSGYLEWRERAGKDVRVWIMFLLNFRNPRIAPPANSFDSRCWWTRAWLS